jgi:chemotaxis protein CheD
MKKTDAIHVNIGKIGISTQGENLRTILGSCVAVALLWEDRKIYGLAHCLVPEASDDLEPASEAKFVDQAIPTLISKMQKMKI